MLGLVIYFLDVRCSEQGGTKENPYPLVPTGLSPSHANELPSHQRAYLFLKKGGKAEFDDVWEVKRGDEGGSDRRKKGKIHIHLYM
jgi:hypothetical protein